jgi:putative spermidine/putrescine transport system ATP-binding protein
MNERGSLRGARVEFRNAGKTYGSLEVLKDFSLSVGAGEFLTLLGPSGSGKTTALNLLAGFIHPTSGDILIDGESVALLPPERRNIGMVFQSYSLFPHMSVFDNVAFPLKMRRAPAREIADRVNRALELVHLSDYGARRPNQLSGGQRQRIAFARAIVFEPRVLLMDEPLGALDLKLREHMQLEIRRYKEQIGCTMIYVTHDQGEALTLSDRIVVMSEGRIVQIGTPREIYDHPKHRFTAEFIGENNILPITPAPEPGRWLIPALGLSFAAAGHPAPAGNLFSIRPESILRVENSKVAPPDHMRFQAVVSECLFFGDIIKYAAALPAGGMIRFKEHRDRATRVMNLGETVTLSFAPCDGVIFHDAPAGRKS